MNFLKVIALIALCFSVSTASFADPQDKTARALSVQSKARQLDLLNHLLPLTLTKAQITALLTPIEKARQNVKKIESMEADDLGSFDAKITAAVDAGVNDAKVPSRDLLKEVNKLFLAMSVRRQVAAGENADLVWEVMVKQLNKGQLAVVANSIDPKAYDPSVDPKTWTDEMKSKLFIKDVLLDPLAYDMLLKMMKKAP